MCVRCGTGSIAWCTDPGRHGEKPEFEVKATMDALTEGMYRTLVNEARTLLGELVETKPGMVTSVLTRTCVALIVRSCGLAPWQSDAVKADVLYGLAPNSPLSSDLTGHV